MNTTNKLTSTLERKKFEFFKEESKRALVSPFQALAKFTAVSGAIALIFEVRYFSGHSIQIYISRLAAITIAFLLLVISNSKFGKKHPAILVHILLLSIISSFGVMIYLIPQTLVFNSHIISLIIFTAALFLSWEITNQIIVSIYYNVVFAISIIFNNKQVYNLPNMFESVVLLLVISVMAVVASYINYRLRQDAIHKNFEVALSEKRFRTFFENSAEGIFQFNREGKFLVVNPSFIKILGYSNEDELKKINFTNDVFKRKNDWDLLSKLLEKQGKVRNYRVPFKKKDGSELTVRMNVRTNDDEEGVILFEGSLQDITQQIQAENEKQKALDALRVEKMKADTIATKAQQESYFKSKFLASMSHEVRTPMNSVMGFLTLIENDLFETKEELKGFAHDAKFAAESLLEIINNILDISKIEAGRMELDEIEINLSEEIYKAISIVSQAAKSKNLIIEKFVDEKIPNKIYGDPTRYRQIILNLLSNAIKFTDQGKITVSVSPESSQPGTKFLIIASYPAPIETQDLVLTIKSSSYLSPITLYDDGKHFDGSPNDGVYGGYFDSTAKSYGTYDILQDSTVLTSFQILPAGCELIGGIYNQNNIKIVMVPSGYSDLDSFEKDAKAIISGENSFSTTEPFKSNTGSFSFFIVNTTRDLGCKIGCNNVPSLVCCNEKAIVEEASRCDYDNIIILVNSTDACGSASSYAHICSENEYSKEILRHEFGHSFGNLADEYVYSETYPSYDIYIKEADMPNCAAAGCQKWKAITSDCIQGCTYSDLYRSAQDSIMTNILASAYSPAAAANLVSVIGQQTNYKSAKSSLPAPPIQPHKSFYINANYNNGNINVDNVLSKPISTGLVTQLTPYTAVLKDKDNKILFVSNISIPLVVYPLPESTNSSQPIIKSEFSFAFLMPFAQKADSLEIYKNNTRISSTSLAALTNVCGNNICEASENHENCPLDCPINDNFCQSGTTCDSDCPSQKACNQSPAGYYFLGASLVLISLIIVIFVIVKNNSKKPE